jgi:hypothetical protein
MTQHYGSRLIFRIATRYGGSPLIRANGQLANVHQYRGPTGFGIVNVGEIRKGRTYGAGITADASLE